MCVCGEDACWILCCGKHKLLLRSAWVVLVITTLIDVGAILAYWHFAPQALDSKPGLKLALILLVAVLIIYFFSTLLSGLIIMKLSPGRREFISVPTSNRNRTGNRLTRFGLLRMPYSDGFCRVLPNNAPTLLSHPNVPITDSTNQHNRLINVRENARSNMDFRNYRNPSENLNLNDGYVNRHNAPSCHELSEVRVVPKVVTTRPENSVPTYENIEANVCESSNKSRNNLGSSTSTTVTPQNEIPYLPQNLEAQTCDLSSRSQSNLCSCSNISFQNKPKSIPQKTFYRSVVSRTSSAVERPNLKTCINQANIYSSNTNLANRRLFSRSESYVNRPVTAEEETLEMSINQNTTSRRVDRNPTISSDLSSGSKATGSEASEQYKNPSSTITRKTNSFLAKSQPVNNPYRRYVVDKLPITPNPQTQRLFKAIMKSEELFEQTNNIPKANYVVKTTPVQV